MNSSDKKTKIFHFSLRTMKGTKRQNHGTFSHHITSNNLDLTKAVADYRCGNFGSAACKFRSLLTTANKAAQPNEILAGLRDDNALTNYGHLKSLALEADAALCELRSRLTFASTNVVKEDDVPLNDLFDHAQKLNDNYCQALWAYLEHQVGQRQPDSSIHATAEGILMARVSSTWLRVKQHNVEAAQWVLAQEAHKLAELLLIQSKEISLPLNTRQDVLMALEKILPSESSALSTFCHTWETVTWMSRRPKPERQSQIPKEVERNRHLDKQGSALEVRHLLFQAVVLDERINNEEFDESSLQKVLEQRDHYLESAVVIESESGDRASRGHVASNLQCLIHSSEAANRENLSFTRVKELACTLQKFLAESKRQSAPMLNLLGCLIARYDIVQALKVFHEALRAEHSRQGWFLCINRLLRCYSMCLFLLLPHKFSLCPCYDKKRSSM